MRAFNKNKGISQIFSLRISDVGMFLRYKKEAVFTEINRCHYDVLCKHLCMYKQSNSMNEIVPPQSAWAESGSFAHKLTKTSSLFLKQLSCSIAAWHFLSCKTARYPLSIWYQPLSILLKADTFSLSSLLWLYVPIFISPHKNSFSMLTFCIFCMWLAADRRDNLFC